MRRCSVGFSFALTSFEADEDSPGLDPDTNERVAISLARGKAKGLEFVVDAIVDVRSRS